MAPAGCGQPAGGCDPRCRRPERDPPQSPRWAIRASSCPGASSPPGCVWYAETAEPADGYACSASPSAGILSPQLADPWCPLGTRQRQSARRNGGFSWRSDGRPMSSLWRWGTIPRARSGACWPTTERTNRTSPAGPLERGRAGTRNLALRRSLQESCGDFGRRVASASGESRRFASSPLRYGPSGDSPLAPAQGWCDPSSLNGRRGNKALAQNEARVG